MQYKVMSKIPNVICLTRRQCTGVEHTWMWLCSANGVVSNNALQLISPGLYSSARYVLWNLIPQNETRVLEDEMKTQTQVAQTQVQAAQTQGV